MISEAPENYAETQIRQLIAEQASAICAKDLDRMMALYAPEVIAFDMKPPFQIRGAEAFRRMWEACLPGLPVSSGTETQVLSIKVSGNLALAHWLWQFTGIEKDCLAARRWFRSTSGYQWKQGRWQIVHEHCSVPFEPQTGQANLACGSLVN